MKVKIFFLIFLMNVASYCGCGECDCCDCCEYCDCWEKCWGKNNGNNNENKGNNGMEKEDTKNDGVKNDEGDKNMNDKEDKIIDKFPLEKEKGKNRIIPKEGYNDVPEDFWENRKWLEREIKIREYQNKKEKEGRKKKEEEERKKKEEEKKKLEEEWGEIENSQKTFLNELSGEYKYDKTVESNVEKITYVIELPIVPFFCDYHGILNVSILFPFKLNNEYFKYFPLRMQEYIENYIKDFSLTKDNIEIFFCYQYLSSKLNHDEYGLSCIGFKPHYFIAQDEIMKLNENFSKLKGKNNENIKGELPADDWFEYVINTGLIYQNNANCFVLSKDGEEKGTGHYSLHNGKISGAAPTLKNFMEYDENINVFYSFVHEPAKKIAAMTIHFFKCPNNHPNYDKLKYCDNIKTIADAIYFAEINNDNEVVEFLNSITK